MANIQKDDGFIRTKWLMRPDTDNFWINCLTASIEALDQLSAFASSLSMVYNRAHESMDSESIARFGDD